MFLLLNGSRKCCDGSRTTHLFEIGSDSTPLTTATSKRPRATNGPSVFAEEHKRKITELMAEQQQKEGGVPKHSQPHTIPKIKQELYDQLTDEEQRAYEAKAAELNKARKALPERSENFKYVDSCLFSAKVNPDTTETKKTSSAEL
jgi:hypothetical protein